MTDISLTQIMSELRRDLEAFEADWLKNHAADPEKYPLSLPSENAGLWSEFFLDFHLSGSGAKEES
jgi:hypothetical protein